MTVWRTRRVDVGPDIRAALLALLSIINARETPEEKRENRKSAECDGQQKEIIRGHLPIPDCFCGTIDGAQGSSALRRSSWRLQIRLTDRSRSTGW
jgi:hypothetical protein